MPDYQRGKIYKITSGDLTYIGSTCEPTLARRLSGHVKAFKLWKTGKKNNLTSFQVLDQGDYEITLIELCPCGSKDELTARERHWIETIPCVNKFIPGQTRKEWNDKNKEYITQWHKKYNEDNKDKIKEERALHYKANIDQVKEQHKAYYQANREKIFAQRKKRAEKSNLIIS
jgi:hypothetical protein